MDWILGGIPLHALLVHFTVVVIPAAALVVVLAAVWPAARQRLGVAPPILAALALIAVPLTVNAGKWLYERVEETPAARDHQEIGSALLPWAIALFAVAALQWLWYRFGGAPSATGSLRSRPGARVAVTVLLLLAVLVAAAGSTAMVVRIGDSGSRAVWTGKISEGP